MFRWLVQALCLITDLSQLGNELFDQDGCQEYPNEGRPIMGTVRLQDPVDRGLGQLESGDEQEDRHDQRSYVFHTAMPEGIFLCGGPGRDMETDDEDHGVHKVR